MAIVSLNKEVTAGNTITEVGLIAADSKCNIYVLNKDNNDGTFRLAISPATPNNKDYVFYNFPLKQYGTFVITDTYIAANDKVWIYAPANFVVRVDGVEVV